MAEANHGLELTAYSTNNRQGSLEFPLITAFSLRDWMDIRDNNPRRCLPLMMANQLGWFVLNPVGIVAEWTGEDEESPIKIEFDEPIPEAQQGFLRDHFGQGILTWTIPYVFRIAPGYNLLVRPPANWLKDGIQGLQGMVESDWLDATFTMNWKFTRAHHPIRFEKHEPFCMLTPIRRGEIEQFEPKLATINDNPAVKEAYTNWFQKRRKSNEEAHLGRLIAEKLNKPYVRKNDLSYMRGQTATGETKISDHQTRLNLKPFSQTWQSRFQQWMNAFKRLNLPSESSIE